MDPYVAAHLRVLEDLRGQVVEAARPLDDDQLNRAVPGLRNTVAVLLRHLAGSERYMIGEVVGGRPANRNRDAEFGMDRLNKGALLEEIERVASRSREVLEGLHLADLAGEVEVRRAQGTFKETRATALLHATQHMAYHLGQIRYLVALLRATS